MILCSVSDCHADSGVGMSTNVNLGFYFVHCEMIVCFMPYFFSSNTYLEEYLGPGVHDQHLPGSDVKRALRPW